MIDHLQEAQRLVRVHKVPPSIAADVVQEYVLLAHDETMSQDVIWKLALRRSWQVFEQRHARYAPWPRIEDTDEPVEFEYSLTTERRTAEERERTWDTMDLVADAMETLPEDNRRAVAEHYGMHGTEPLSRTQRAERHGTNEDHERRLLQRGRQLIERRIADGGLVPERATEEHDPVLLASIIALPTFERQVAEARLEGLGPADTARRLDSSLSKIERTIRTIQRTTPLPKPRRVS